MSDQMAKKHQNLRIIYASSSVVPSKYANSVHTMRICQALSKVTDHITLIVPAFPRRREKTEKTVQDFYGVSGNFQILRTLSFPKMTSFFLAFRTCIEALKHKGSIVFSRDPVTAYVSSLLGIRTIFETHSPARLVKGLKGYFFRRAILSSNTISVVVISDALKDILVDEFDDELEAKVVVAHDGADVPILPAQSLSGIKRAGYIGHLYQGRGIDVIVELAKRMPSVEFNIVGGRPEDVESWKSRVGNVANLVFWGFISPSETESFRAEMDVLLAPYQKTVFVESGMNTAEWMSPLKVFEYMSSGRPIVISDLPVLREVLSENEALLVPPDSIGDWESAIRKLQDDLPFAQQIAKRSFEKLKNNFSWDKRVEHILNSTKLN
ncbi:MAG: glycosyltransferase family 4 protein [Bdellovibrionales bacterium]|nr:glycosyltransferase family 4 protein [Bdellovibrionales bacterium]